MKIMVTGADGFVASSLIPKLLGHDIVAVDYLHSAPNNISQVEFINVDLSREIPEVGGIDLIIHLATVNQLTISSYPMLVKVNTCMIQNILELAVKSKAKLIFSSSCSVYGSGLNIHESHEFNPQSLYGVGKCYEEMLVQFYHARYGLDATILRFSNCYGDTTNICNKVYPGKKDAPRLFMESILTGKPVSLIRGMGRDYTYIDDVVEAILSVMPLEGVNVFNVATGVETLTDELATVMIKTLNLPATIDITPPRDTDNITHRSLNVEKISSYWKPKTTLEEGLKKYACKFN